MENRVCELYYDQFSTKDGVVNRIEIRHPNIPGHGTKIQYNFLHVGNWRTPTASVLDGYVCAVIFFAMEHADVLRVHGPLSEEFTANMRLFSEAWSCWLPNKYSTISIEAEKYLSALPITLHSPTTCTTRPEKKKKTIASFSGGADASFTLLRHALRNGKLPEHQRYGVEDVVMVHGFDVRYDNEIAFESLRRRVEPILELFDVECHVVRTDLKVNEIQLWSHSFLSQLASVLHQFSETASHALVGSSEPYSNLVNAWGSHPATDYLLSGPNFRIVHDGAGYSRTAKVNQIAPHSDIANSLRVCWAGSEQDRNCGRCEKCIRTKLNFIATGSAIPACFDEDLTPDQVLCLDIASPVLYEEFRSIVDYALAHQTASHPLIQALSTRLSLIESSQQPPKPGQQKDVCQLYAAEAEELRNELTSVYQSSSWRLTQPLRAARRGISALNAHLLKAIGR